MSRSNPSRSSIAVLALWAAVLQAGGLAALAADGPPASPTVASAAPTSIPHRSPVDPTATTTSTTGAPAPTTTSTTTAPPAPSSTVPPPPPALPAPAPAPAPPAPPSPPPPAMSTAQRVQAAFEAAVPAVWRSAITVRLEVIDGSTSWGYPDGRIQVGTAHATGSESRLRATLAHEFGHLIAFRYGSRAYNGAAPEGWPAYSSRPEEAWADCVSQGFTGIVDPSHGLPPCSGSSLSWTTQWLGQGPPAG